MPHSSRSERGGLAAARSRPSCSHQRSSSSSVRRGWSVRRISLRMSSSVRRTGSESGVPSPQAAPASGVPAVPDEPVVTGSAGAGRSLTTPKRPAGRSAGGRSSSGSLPRGVPTRRRRCPRWSRPRSTSPRMRSKRAGSPRSCSTATAMSAMAASTAEIWNGPLRSEAGWMATSRPTVALAAGGAKTTVPLMPDSELPSTASSKRSPAPTAPMTAATRASGSAAWRSRTTCASGSRTVCTAPSARCSVRASRRPVRARRGPEDAGQRQRGRSLGTDGQRGGEVGEGEVLGGPVDGRLAEDEADGRRDAWSRSGLTARTRRRPERLAPERHPEAEGHVGRAVQQGAQVGSHAGRRPLTGIEGLDEGAHDARALLEDRPGVALAPLA